MKKKLLAYLCMTVMAISLVGCGSSSISDSSDKKTNAETTTDEDGVIDEDQTTTKKKSKKDKDETTLEKDETTDEDETTTDEDESATEREISGGTDDWTAYTGTGYSLSASDDWTKYDYAASDLTLASLGTSADGFTENITVVLQDLSSYDLDLEGFNNLSVKQYETQGNTVISNKKTIVNGVDGYLLESEMEQDGVLCCCLQFYTLVDDTAYIFTFVGDSDGYSELSDDVLDIFSTIVFD